MRLQDVLKEREAGGLLKEREAGGLLNSLGGVAEGR